MIVSPCSGEWLQLLFGHPFPMDAFARVYVFFVGMAEWFAEAGEPTGHSGLVFTLASFLTLSDVGELVLYLVFSATKRERKSIGCDLHR